MVSIENLELLKNKDKIMKLTKAQIIKHIKVGNLEYTKKQLGGLKKDLLVNLLTNQTSKLTNLPNGKINKTTGKYNKQLRVSSLFSLPENSALQIKKEMIRHNMGKCETEIRRLAPLVRKPMMGWNINNAGSYVYVTPLTPSVNPNKLMYLIKHAKPSVTAENVLAMSRGMLNHQGKKSVPYYVYEQPTLIEKKMLSEINRYNNLDKSFRNFKENIKDPRKPLIDNLKRTKCRI